MDPFSAILLGTQFAAPFFGRLFGGGEEVSSGIPAELRTLLAQALLSQGRQQALVDPAASQLFGFQPPPEAVPLRPLVNQLAFALQPNYVRPSNSLFPGTAPPFSSLLPGIDFRPPFMTPGAADPGAPDGLTPEDVQRREGLHEQFASDIESGMMQVHPVTGRLILAGFNDRRGEGPISLDDIRRRLTKASDSE